MIQFTIQTLEGNTFQVSIPLSEAEKVCTDTESFPTFYEQYGLDALKEAIQSHHGTANAVQQLICLEEELTISTLLIPLATSVITLIVMVPFQIEFIPSCANDSVDVSRIDLYPLLANLELLALAYGYGHGFQSVAYLHLCNESTHTRTHRLRVVGQTRDYLKIAFCDLNASGGVIRKTRWVEDELYQITDDTPTHVWLHFDKAHMKIME